MNPWIETLGVALLIISAILLGLWFSKLPKLYWLIGYLIPLGGILIYVLAEQFPTLMFHAPFSWLMLGRNKFLLFGIVTAMLLATPLPRLKRKRDRIFVWFLMLVIVGFISIWPFVAPAFNRDYLAHLKTRIDADGICRQSTSYTCAPAAAVTALRKLGFQADEGEIAILAHTSQATGTPPDILADALRKRYGNEGLEVEFRPFKKVNELKNDGITLANVEFGFMVDHCVTVLKVTENTVIIGDPLNGLTVMSYEDFAKEWYFVGVVLRRRI